MHRALEIWCIEEYFLTLKRCFLFNNHGNSAINFELRRNFGICASLDALSILVKTVFFFVEVTETETESRPKWRLLTTLHFVHNKFISLNQSFMQKIGTR